MAEPNKYVAMMRNEARTCEKTAGQTPFSGEVFAGHRVNLLRDAADWRAAAAAFEAMVEFLKAHEQWEAQVLMDDAAWRDGVDGLPQCTQAIYDAAMELQAKRNAALTKASGT